MSKVYRHLLHILFPEKPFEAKGWEVQQARYLHGLLLIFSFSLIMLVVVRHLGMEEPVWTADITLMALVVVYLVLVAMMRRGNLIVPQYAFILLTWGGMAYLTFVEGQGIVDTALTAQFVILVASSMLLVRHITVLLAGLIIIEVWLLAYLHQWNWMELVPDRPTGIARDLTAIVFMITLFVLYFVWALKKSRQDLFDQLQARQRVEAALLQAERLAAVGTLTAGVAHQFNNINTSILGFTELCLVESQLPPALRDKLERVRAAAIRSREVTRGLLSFSKQNAFRPKLDNLTSVIRETLGLVEDDLRAKGIEVTATIRPTPDVMMDATQIGQVLHNLFVNAEHAMVGRSRKRITVETGSDDRWVWVSLRDTGCGIPLEHQKQVFTPFFSTKGEHAIPGSPQEVNRGTGLGLSVAHSIVAQHEGELDLESDVDVGTVITMRLPRESVKSMPQDEALRPMDANEASQIENSMVLIVEDDSDVRAYLQSVLEIDRCAVMTAADGTAGLTALNAQQFQLVVLDLQMPGMSGLDFIYRLREVPQESRPAVLVLTGHLSSAISLDSLRAILPDAELGLLRKPVQIETFRATVRDLVMRQRGGEGESDG